MKLLLIIILYIILNNYNSFIMIQFDESDLAAEKTNLNILERLTSVDIFSIADIAVVDIRIDDSKLKIRKLTIENNNTLEAEYQKYIEKVEKKERRKKSRLNSFRISKGNKYNYDYNYD